VKAGRLNRRELLTGAAVGGAVVSGAVASAASAATADAQTVSKTLAAELLAVFCYQHVLRLGTLGPAAQQVAALILSHEQAHVRALEAELRSLGGTPPVGPASIEQADAELKARHSSGRLKGLRSEHAVLDFLYSVESITIGAHDQALEKLSDPQLVRASVEIMGAEAQHAAAIGALLHPGRFDRIAPVNFVKGKT
jgi:cytochrome c551/c552